MAIHTPGPWALDSNGPGHEVVLGRGGRHSIAAVQGPDDHRENLANARLIASAPDLYAACELFTAAAHDVVALLNGKGLACPASIAFAAEQARHAIAKAEGR